MLRRGVLKINVIERFTVLPINDLNPFGLLNRCNQSNASIYSNVCLILMCFFITPSWNNKVKKGDAHFYQV